MQQTEAMEQGREGSEEKEEQLTAQQKIELERQEEAKLKQKYPTMGGKPGLPGKPAGGPGGQSSFLQKRMAKNAKFFDSGDYQMNKQQAKGPGIPGLKLGLGMPQAGPTGQVIPTPDLVPARKNSTIQPRDDRSLPHGIIGSGADSPTAGGGCLSPGHAATSQLSL